MRGFGAKTVYTIVFFGVLSGGRFQVTAIANAGFFPFDKLHGQHDNQRQGRKDNSRSPSGMTTRKTTAMVKNNSNSSRVAVARKQL
jgi:hypothetical protein